MSTLLNHDWDIVDTLPNIRSRIGNVDLVVGWNYVVGHDVVLIAPKYIVNDEQYYTAFCWHSSEHDAVRQSVISMLQSVVDAPVTTHEAPDAQP